MTLHTSDGCSIDPTGFSGSLLTSNCYVQASGQDNNAGCGIQATSSNSYGAGFNGAGGGVYATEWTGNAISIWFFPRSSIPGDISSGNPNPSSWGIPAARFAGNCDIDSHFTDMQIVLLPSLLSSLNRPFSSLHKHRKKTNTSSLRSST
jgi:hypothetical protein